MLANESRQAWSCTLLRSTTSTNNGGMGVGMKSSSGSSNNNNTALGVLKNITALPIDNQFNSSVGVGSNEELNTIVNKFTEKAAAVVDGSFGESDKECCLLYAELLKTVLSITMEK